jgi:hypothetical protein
MSPLVLIARRHRFFARHRHPQGLAQQYPCSRTDAEADARPVQCRRSDTHRRFKRMAHLFPRIKSMVIILVGPKQTYREYRLSAEFVSPPCGFRCLRMGLVTKCCLLSPEWLFLTSRFWRKEDVGQIPMSVKCLPIAAVPRAPDYAMAARFRHASTFRQI